MAGTWSCGSIADKPSDRFDGEESGRESVLGQKSPDAVIRGCCGNEQRVVMVWPECVWVVLMSRRSPNRGGWFGRSGQRWGSMRGSWMKEERWTSAGLVW